MKFRWEERIVVNPERGHGYVHRFLLGADKSLGCKALRSSSVAVEFPSPALRRCARCERSFQLRSGGTNWKLVQKLARDLRGKDPRLAIDEVRALVDACLPETSPAPWETES